MSFLNTEIIFMAAPAAYLERTYPGYKNFFENFYNSASKYHKIIQLDLPDIWVRDFLPLQNANDGRLFQHFFSPAYANYTYVFSEKIRKAVKSFFPKAVSMDLRIDGGNVVMSPEKIAFCFEKQTIFHKNNLKERKHAENCLKNAMGAVKTVWLPRETGDRICHIDGFMQFFGKYLMVSDERFDPYLEKLLLKRIETVKREIPSAEIIYLPCCPAKNCDYLNANGIYVNFLETSKAVFVPQYGITQDKEALSIFEAIADKPVAGIPCGQISLSGGAVHCLTREYSL